ncbi:aminoacyl-tRNA hydrolase [Boudabousia marimammalium]|uniref:Peptidyl-tRNA hydrolase n=1 Tax=Boudabousia marimammalium TaxID=156892 RepID=A0A1Q5PRX5_9ACTO|nr:aminoacyl-tRNA hydrolase [Boudabousia marimammalium]OKL50283.1 aminoacyl-tRNA hydrolase [Boudabousia marimammalium]
MTSTSTPWIIVGLGNPGSQYAKNRHNIGQMVIHALAAEAGATLVRHKARAQVAEARLGILPGGAPGPRVVLATLDSYMNTSGGPTAALLKFYSASAENLLVIHDELDIPEHALRLKLGGGEGGHNGLRSITSALGTKNYHRLRVGIGRPPGRMDTADYVLSNFPPKAAADWQVTIQEAAEAAEDVVTLGFLDAQQRLHSRQ